MKPLPARDQDSPLNLRVVPMTWQEPKPSSIRPLWVKWFQNLRCVNISGGCPDPCTSIVLLASQSSLFQEVLEDEEFSSDWVTPRIIGVKNLSLGALEKFISFLYTGHIVIMNSHIIRDLLKLAATLHVEKTVQAVPCWGQCCDD